MNSRARGLLAEVVDLQIRRLAERFEADRTLVRLLARVNVD
jgi:hypothetical protein